MPTAPPAPSRLAPPTAGRFTGSLTRLRRAVRRRRRPLAALAAAVAVGASLMAMQPPAAPSAAVLVAARDLPAGAVLTDTDLVRAEVAPASVPDGALADPAGEILAAPVRRGEPVTDARVLGPGLAPQGAGQSAVPVRISDAGQAALLATGDRIDLWATAPAEGTTIEVASDVPVLAVPDPGSHGGAGGGGGTLSGQLVVVGLPPSAVATVTAAAVVSFVTFSWAQR